MRCPVPITVAEMLFRITTEAAPDRVFEALTTEEGLAGWWTTDVEAEAATKGARASFGFEEHAVVFDMSLEEVVPGKRLVWACSSDVEEWNGTRLTWALTKGEDGGTVVELTHAGWKERGAYFRTCNTTWGHLMYQLQAYLDTGKAVPFFV